MTTLYLDIENVPAVTGEWKDLLLGGYAVDDGPVEQVRWRDFESDEANMFSEQAYRLLDLLQDSKVDKVSHSAHDVRWMMQAGSGIAGPYHDTMVMAWLINENTPLDLDWLADRYSNIDMDKRLKRSGGRVWFRDNDDKLWALDEVKEAEGFPWDQFEEYNVRDVEALRELYLDMRERLEESGRWDHFVDEEAPYSAVLRRMEARGMPIDLRAVTVLAHEITREKDQAKEQLLADAGLPDSFNLGSQPQLVAYLFSRQFHLNDKLEWGPENCASLKECAADDHDICDVVGHHMTALVPDGFHIDSIGRTTVHGHWSLKGRGLPPTPPTVDKVTGKTGKLPSTASPVLLYEVGTDDWVRQLCTGYRKYEKLLNTYLLKFPRIAVEAEREVASVDGDVPATGGSGSAPQHSASARIYGRYNQTGTVTGRLSSSDPNMQNMPARGSLGKKVRALFVAQLLVGDYDQIEMRLMAHYSQDKRMVRIFRDGLDPHVETMHGIFGDVDPHGIAIGASIEYRDAAKQLNYAMGYGAGKKKVAQTLSLFGFPTTDEVAGGYLAEMESFYKGYFRWKKTVINGAKRRGNVRTLGGRVRHLRSQFADTANWKLMSYGERQAVNTKIQGSAADIIRRGMVVADRDFPELGMLAQVHDEVVWEYYDLPDHETLGRLQRAMEEGHGYDLRVPLGFHPVVVDNWGQKGIGGADWWIAAEAEEE